MVICCGRPSSAAFYDPFAYIAGYARKTIVEICSTRVGLATMPIVELGSATGARV